MRNVTVKIIGQPVVAAPATMVILKFIVRGSSVTRITIAPTIWLATMVAA